MWSSSDNTRAFVTTSGIVNAVAEGTVTISATSGNTVGRATVRVFPSLATGALTLSPDETSLQVGGTTTFTVIVRDVQGNQVFNRPVTWSTSSTPIALVTSQTSAEAFVAGIAAGNVTVIASSGGRQGTATMHVVAPPVVASLAIAPVSLSISVGHSATLVATATDASGTKVSLPITWSAPDANTIALSNNLVRGVAVGTTTVTAATGGKTAQVTVTVTPFVPLSGSAIATANRGGCSLDSGVASCWGQTFFGLRGDGSIADTLSHPVPGRITNAPPFTSITAGDSHACAISPATSATTVYCWGSNTRGQLGTGTLSPACLRFGASAACSGTPVAVAGALSLKQVSAGGMSTCGLTNATTIHCWGDNTTGQLGNGTTIQGNTPTLVASTEAFSSVAVGRSHTCALAVSGHAFCWGSNASGQLGSLTRTTCTDAIGRVAACSTTPMEVAGARTYVNISAGGDHTCAITSGGDTYCWGSNTSGELGNESMSISTLPSLVAGNTRFTSISAGDQHTCALTAVGAAFCWGTNDGGQLGNGTRIALSTSPTAASAALLFSAISAGTTTTCGISAQRVYCWGSNLLGDLGNGDTVARLLPTLVTAP